MADETGGTDYQVAFRLAMIVRDIENFNSRKDLLDAYAECLQAVRLPSERLS